MKVMHNNQYISFFACSRNTYCLCISLSCLPLNKEHCSSLSIHLQKTKQVLLCSCTFTVEVLNNTVELASSKHWYSPWWCKCTTIQIQKCNVKQDYNLNTITFLHKWKNKLHKYSALHFAAKITNSYRKM